MEMIHEVVHDHGTGSVSTDLQKVKRDARKLKHLGYTVAIRSYYADEVFLTPDGYLQCHADYRDEHQGGAE